MNTHPGHAGRGRYPARPRTAGTSGHGEQRAAVTDVPVLLLTVTEAARVLSISRSSLYLLLQRGELASVTLGGSRRITVTALRDYVEHLTDHTPRDDRKADGRPVDGDLLSTPGRASMDPCPPPPHSPNKPPTELLHRGTRLAAPAPGRTW